MKSPLPFCLFAAVASVAYAQPVRIDRVDVADYGLYSATVLKAERDAKGVLQNSSTDIRHVETTRNIPAQLGVRFGYRFVLVGTPKAAEVKVRKVTIYPRELTPDNGRPISRSEVIRNVQLGDEQYDAYRFDDPWELATGVWTFELWVDDQKLLTQSFTVVKPASEEGKPKS